MLKRNRIELDQAMQAIAAYRQIPIRYVDVELEDTLEIAARYAIYAYDAYLIRCGLKFGAPLLSLDRGLLSVAEQAGVHTLEVR
jgi:predicted nucleic acid-binding protein